MVIEMAAGLLHDITETQRAGLVVNSLTIEGTIRQGPQHAGKLPAGQLDQRRRCR